MKASHLNVMKNVPGAFGSQMIVESSIYGRLGLTTANDLYEGILLTCPRASVFGLVKE